MASTYAPKSENYRALIAALHSQRGIGDSSRGWCISNPRNGSSAMKIRLLALSALCIASSLTLGAASDEPRAEGARYAADGQVLRPENYREWPLIGTGLNMTYGPAGDG